MNLIEEMKSVVAGVIGDDQMACKIVQSLLKRFGGERLYLPINDYEARNRELVELYRAGATVEQLARRARLSVKTVYRIIGQE